MKSFRLLAAAAVGLLAVPLAGCVPQPSPTSTPTGEQVAAEHERYYAQQLIWEDCGNGMQCATAFAPLDWSAPDEANDIELALVRQTAKGDREGSLFVNPGGPGASGFDFIYESVDFAVSDDLQNRFDVIGWDPRGVGRSSAIDCYTDPQLDEFLFAVTDAPVGSDEYAQEVTESAKDFANACLENTGELLQFVDTASTVRDLDMLRAAVGDTALNYVGYSYGSDIGAQYADRFSDKVGRVVLDGATDPTVTSFDLSLAQTEASADALRAYLADCLGSADCPFRGSEENAIGQIRDILDRLDEAPIRGEDGRDLNSAYLGTAIRMALYDEGTWEYLTQAFTEVQQGRSEIAFFLADAYVDRDENGDYTSNIMEAFLAISCIDYPVETDPAELARQRDLLAEANPLVEAEDVDALGNVVCQQWPYQFQGEIAPVTGDGAAPILVVGTTGDPATPYEWAEAVADQLESGVLLTYVGEGHIAYDERDPCIVGAVDKYLIDGTVPQDGLVCDPS
jgi:pimeloyl-ACP methyl ester carboxylesterase